MLLFGNLNGEVGLRHRDFVDFWGKFFLGGVASFCPYVFLFILRCNLLVHIVAELERDGEFALMGGTTTYHLKILKTNELKLFCSFIFMKLKLA